MSKNTPPLITQQLARIGAWGTALIIVLLPFHAFLTAWGATVFGSYDLLRSWKEALLLVGLLLAIGIVVTDKTQRWKQLLKQTPMLWVLGYACLTLIFSLITLWGESVTRDALLYGLMIQLRFMCFFGLVAVFSLYDDLIFRRWQRLLLGPAVVVVIFGLLQIFILPSDFLTQFGYGPDTIPAFQTIDNKLEFQRIQSTLRGANPYGAYLVLIITALVTRMYARRRNYWSWAFLLAATVNLYFTYSRSAWVGLLLSLAVLSFLFARHRITKSMVLVGVTLCVVAVSGIWLLRDNDYVQNTLFHSDETSISEQSSNQQRGQALASSFEDIVLEPLGGGVGSAGPASFRNQPAVPRVAENYFIQTGQEMGWLGLAGIVAVMVAVGRWLYRQRNSRLATVLLASLIGLTFINFVSHAWADDVISLLWWGLAGALMGHGILNKEQTKSKKEV
jgi:hypothetical protein